MRVVSHSEKDTLNFGKKLAGYLKKGNIVCLFGELGSGKTVFVKGIAGGLGIKQSKIISPTFILINQSTPAKLSLYHFDLYRLKSPRDILTLGYEEYFFSDGITVIEWADRLGYLLPKEYLKVELSIKSAKQRWLKFSSFGNYYQKLLRKIYENIRHRHQH